jgi:hypothetical protein
VTALEIVIAAEDESDARRIRSLIDRILVAEIAWLAEQPEPRSTLLDGLRQWRGHDATSSFLDIHQIHALADARGLPNWHGHFDGRPAALDFHSAVRALWIMLGDGEPSGLIWVRDTDGETSRIQGWRDACAEAGADFPVLIGGFPHECMEAWLLVALTLDPRTPHFRKLCQQLGFNPLDHPELLSHKPNVPKSAKAVCSTLGADEESWLDADPEDLERRGADCGLAEFIAELRDKLAPAIQRGP